MLEWDSKALQGTYVVLDICPIFLQVGIETVEIAAIFMHILHIKFIPSSVKKNLFYQVNIEFRKIIACMKKPHYCVNKFTQPKV